MKRNYAIALGAVIVLGITLGNSARAVTVVNPRDIFPDAVKAAQGREKKLNKTPEGRKALEARDKFMKAIEEAQKKEMDRQEKIRAEKEKLTERLSTIRDEKKKQILLHLQDQLQNLNDKMVMHFNAVISQMTAVLARIEARTPATAEAQALIAKAKAAILAATDAVTAQGKKIYSITFEGAKLKEGVKAVREKLHADLKAVREKIVAAREAVHATEKVAPPPPKPAPAAASDNADMQKPEMVQ